MESQKLPNACGLGCNVIVYTGYKVFEDPGKLHPAVRFVFQRGNEVIAEAVYYASLISGQWQARYVVADQFRHQGIFHRIFPATERAFALLVRSSSLAERFPGQVTTELDTRAKRFIFYGRSHQSGGAKKIC